MSKAIEKIKKLFFETNISYKTVIILSIVSAILTAFFLQAPLIKNTSLANMGVTIEVWILIAIIIINNQSRIKDAVLKTFLFFLISQPLIYLLQVPFVSQGFGIFIYYKRWFIYTLLTIPGSFIAYYVKKDNVLSSIILSFATGLLGYELIDFLFQCINNFPKHLLTCIFILLEILVLIFILLNKKKTRIITITITIIVIITTIFNKVNDINKLYKEERFYLGSDTNYKIESYKYNTNNMQFEIIDDYLYIKARMFDSEILHLIDDNSNHKTIIIDYTSSGINISEN